MLRYAAAIDPQGVSVGVRAVQRQSPLGRLQGTDNPVMIRTRRYDSNPLILTGPGAGAEVTAAGILNDALAIAPTQEHYGRPG